MGIIENNEAILGNNRSILGEILNRIIGRKNRIIGTALQAMNTGTLINAHALLTVYLIIRFAINEYSSNQNKH